MPDLQPLFERDYAFGPNVWNDARSYLPNLEDQLAESWAMPSARAADASHSSLLRVSTIGGIAIAAFAALYFVVEFLR